jgi:diadenosine tetraphosphatase ApaH/serine/threonine PP2A family protein phosphatase
MSARVVFYGHTHLQSAISQLHTRISSWDSESTLDLGGRALWLINPGAVGQPRDGDPRAAWALFDSATNQVQLRRTPYDIEAARAVILGAGLPARLGNRLRKGE